MVLDFELIPRYEPGSTFQVVVAISGRPGVAFFVRKSLLNIDIVYIDIDMYDVEYNAEIHIFMEDRKRPTEALHAWLVMLKAGQSMSRYVIPPLLEEGLGESDFRVLEVLLHKGAMPVNAIGPKVDLNPGSVSVAVDRLYKKGFVSRVESSSDRRVRTVSLTDKGREMFVPVFRRHAALIKRAFQGVSSEELRQLEAVLKKIGKRAESLAETKGHLRLSESSGTQV